MCENSWISAIEKHQDPIERNHFVFFLPHFALQNWKWHCNLVVQLQNGTQKEEISLKKWNIEKLCDKTQDKLILSKRLRKKERDQFFLNSVLPRDFWWALCPTLLSSSWNRAPWSMKSYIPSETIGIVWAAMGRSVSFLSSMTRCRNLCSGGEFQIDKEPLCEWPETEWTLG